jgi:hypothetical protein
MSRMIAWWGGSALAVILVPVLALLTFGERFDGRAVVREMNTIRVIDKINAAQARHFDSTGVYASSFDELDERPGWDLDSGVRGGYIFDMKLTSEGYELHASPAPGFRNLHPFYSDQTRAIRESFQGPAGPRSPNIRGDQ